MHAEFHFGKDLLLCTMCLCPNYIKNKEMVSRKYLLFESFHRLASLVVAFSASLDTGMHKVFSEHNKKVKV